MISYTAYAATLIFFLYTIYRKGLWALIHPLKDLEQRTDNPGLVRTFTRKDRIWQTVVALILVGIFVTAVICPDC